VRRLPVDATSSFVAGRHWNDLMAMVTVETPERVPLESFA
jgi:hypothetical protein